jgi:hypothetical protein
MAFWQWIKTHKLTVFLILVVLFMLLRQLPGGIVPVGSRSYGGLTDSISMGSPSVSNFSAKSLALPAIGGSVGAMPVNEAAPQTASSRMTIQESNISLLVKNVTETRDSILNFAQENGGYMVNSATSNPQDAPTATLTIRVKADKLKAALDYFHTLAIKVVSENLSGYDVTDQYVDIDKHIALLEATKAKFQSILDQAKEISDITNLNQQIISIQDQIDSYKGQQQYLKQNADLAKITVYLATDEIALPYAPSETWRPEVIFKEAVRSLVGTLRGLGTNLIWIAVYGAIWIPIAAIAYFVWKFMMKRNASQTGIPSRKVN